MPGRVSDIDVFDAAIRVVAEVGYDRATTRRIADAAGINEATLFRRFDDKQRLLLAAVQHEVGGFALDAVPTGDLGRDLVRVVEHYARVFTARGGLVLTLMLEAGRNPTVASVLRAPRAVMGALDDLILHYQRAGELVAEPPRTAIHALVGPLFLRAVAGQMSDHEPQPVSAEAAVTRFLSGHGTAAP